MRDETTDWLITEGAERSLTPPPTGVASIIIQHPTSNIPRTEPRPMPVSFTVNGRATTVDVAPEMPLLWVLRDTLDLKGTKFGCGLAQCGACTVHLDGTPIRSCSTPVSAAEGKQVTTIEGLSDDGSHPLQEAWVEVDVAQCGYCQAGQIMSAAALLAEHPKPTDEQIDAAMNGNLCRCATYLRIRSAIHKAAGQ
jgi:aerobic-type carbon monoxide dehydrogenase small subunit (CoxS/CutS family)